MFGLDIFPTFEVLSNNGLQEKPHFNNLIKLYHFYMLPLSLFLISWFFIVESSNFYFFLTNLQMGPVALPILIPACFTHAFRSDSALFFSLGHQDLSFSFPLNFPSKKSITIHLVLPVGNNHRHIREHDQYYEGSPLSLAQANFPQLPLRRIPKYRSTSKSLKQFH